nr:uncharacterized protein LOC111420674 [Onthophagus taurus]
MKRIILDCDVGTDDALALLILLKADQEKLVKIEAICCSMGNTSIENVCINVMRLLQITKRTDIPVYRGVKDELIKHAKLKTNFHGNDGFGDLSVDVEPNLDLIKSEPSPIGMYSIAKKLNGDVSLMVLGPLTNPALTIKLFPDFTELLHEILIMGGNYKAIGNITKTAEYNFHVDPEAAHIVLNDSKCPITILPWETCLKPKITFDWRWNVFGKINLRPIQLLTEAERNIYTHKKDFEYWLPCDAFLAAAFVNPACLELTKSFHATVELHGYETRGQLILDHNKNEKDNVVIITKINENVFKNVLMNLSTLNIL